MLHINKAFPTQYQMIEKIKTVELRHNLKSLVSTLDDLVRETKPYPIDDDTLRTVTRFYDYLKHSCASPEAVNTKGPWLYKMGMVALSRMTSFRNKFLNKESGEESLEYQILETKIDDLSDAFIQYQQSDPTNTTVYSEQATLMLENIVICSQSTRPSPGSRYYYIVTNEVQHLIDTIRRVNKMGGKTFDDNLDEYLEQVMMRLFQMMRSYHWVRLSSVS